MSTVTFELPAPLLNMNAREHWAKRAAKVAAWRSAAFYATKQARVKPMGLTLVRVTLPVRSLKVRRDPSNCYPCIKAIVDGITSAGVWPDDDARYVVTQEPTFTLGTTVTVELVALTGRQGLELA